ncbi:MAG: 30S ribosomal protein S17 [Longimicrobiales bacterium]
MAEESGAQRASRKTRVGVVVSNKATKTLTVTVERRVSHPLYGKQVTRTKKYYVHDEEQQAREGDVVRIVETRPLSKMKRWRLVEIVERAK